MTKLKHTEINLQTGETTVRDYTDEEMAIVAAEEALDAERQAKAAAKAIEKAALLAKLGITAEEAALLLGGN
jgi:hypothetical protein